MSDPDIQNEEMLQEQQASSVDEGQRKRRETKAKRQAREDRDFFRLVVQSEVGRRFLHSILREAHTFETKFGIGPAGVPDPLASWMFFGEQQLGQRLYQTWHLRAPAEIMQMLRECEPKYQKVEV